MNPVFHVSAMRPYRTSVNHSQPPPLPNCIDGESLSGKSITFQSPRVLVEGYNNSYTGKDSLTLKPNGSLLRILRMLLKKFVSFGNSKDKLVHILILLTLKVTEG
jgi:hypothetical protein